MNESGKTPNRQIIAARADQIETRKVRWLWPNRIPLGKLTIFAGVPGEGKSLATVDIAARVTTANDYPDVQNPLPASEVLFVAGEDDPDDALVPRLTAADADLSKVQIHKTVRENGRGGADHSFRLDLDVSAIDRFLDEHPDIRLVVIDPISNHLGVSMVDEQEVREALLPLTLVAQARHVAIVCVMHLNKKEGLSAINRVSGAGAFIGVARASWLFAKDSQSAHFMLPVKNNYAGDLSSLGYRVNERGIEIEGEDVPTPYIEWLEEADLDVDKVISAQRKPTPRADAKAFLKTFLAGGPQDANAVHSAAVASGIAPRTLTRAKEELGIESRKKGLEGWEWLLPDVRSKDAIDGKGESGILQVVSP